jgi:hypothetical protein
MLNNTENDLAPGAPAPLRANLPSAAWLRTICGVQVIGERIETV